MNPKIKEQADKKIKEGWIRSSMMVEVLAVNEDTARSALEKHITALEREKKTFVFRKDFKEGRRVERPFPHIPEGYSFIVDLELLTENFETLVYLAMNYGPSSLEILSPEKITLSLGEAQGVAVSVAEMVHKFVRSGAGGLLIKT